MSPQPLQQIGACVFDADGAPFDFNTAASAAGDELGDALDSAPATLKIERSGPRNRLMKLYLPSAPTPRCRPCPKPGAPEPIAAGLPARS